MRAERPVAVLQHNISSPAPPIPGLSALQHKRQQRQTTSYILVITLSLFISFFLQGQFEYQQTFLESTKSGFFAPHKGEGTWQFNPGDLKFKFAMQKRSRDLIYFPLHQRMQRFKDSTLAWSQQTCVQGSYITDL